MREPDHFDWQKQARFYWMHDDDRAQICVADVPFWYCNEYLGVKERLVITPLTDRCYVTLSQALGMFLYISPISPLYLPYISRDLHTGGRLAAEDVKQRGISPLYLPDISPISPLYLP